MDDRFRELVSIVETELDSIHPSSIRKTMRSSATSSMEHLLYKRHSCQLYTTDISAFGLSIEMEPDPIEIWRLSIDHDGYANGYVYTISIKGICLYPLPTEETERPERTNEETEHSEICKRLYDKAWSRMREYVRITQKEEVLDHFLEQQRKIKK